MADTWRVVTTDGSVHDAPVVERINFIDCVGVEAWKCGSRAARGHVTLAIAAWSEHKGLDVLQFVPPGRMIADERVAEERASIVAFLHTLSDEEAEEFAGCVLITYADAIERGEHRKDDLK